MKVSLDSICGILNFCNITKEIHKIKCVAISSDDRLLTSASLYICGMRPVVLIQN